MADASTPVSANAAHWPRTPAVSAAFALATGILLDAALSPGFTLWLAAGAALAAGGIVTAATWGRRTKAPAAALGAACSVLALWMIVGGLRHHAGCALRGDDSIVTCLSADRTPARLVGRLESALLIDPAEHSPATPRWTQIDRTLGLLQCEALGPLGEELAVSGTVRIEVTGHLLGPQIGDRLELFGQLQRPSGPRNPGGFDFATWLRRSGVEATFQVEHPDHVRPLSSAPGWGDRIGRWRDRLRREAEWVFIDLLTPAQAALATSLLLGDRSGLNAEIEQQFAASGTMHLLAISGLNVGILAGLVHLMCRLLKTGPWTTTAALLVMVMGYAFVTDQRPPVLRAALLATVVLSGWRMRREAGGYQSLGLCALAVLLYRPADLFDAGAQLSFLAVLAIAWSSHWHRERDLTPADADDSIVPEWMRRTIRWTSDCLWQAYVLTGSIWLFTLPLTLWHFHLCSPVGLAVNVVLIPLTTVMLAAGYLMVLLGLAHPLLAVLPAWLFGLLLGWMMWLVEVSAGTPLGHHYLPGPSGLWLGGFYLCLGAATRLIPLPLRAGWAWRLLSVWVLGGLAWGLQAARPEGLRATFLAVGHGCAVLVETPTGNTLLFDGGSFVDGRRAQRTIQSALWTYGHSQLSAVIVSHADMDHFNGVPDLMATLPVGSLLFAPSCLDFAQEGVEDLCESAVRRGVPLRLAQAGDRLALDPEVDCEILHPPAKFRDVEDNANSIVLKLAYRGRSLLLTGDLEEAGLERLLGLPTDGVDVLMSPHHGSLGANPGALAAWAQPKVVIASSADEKSVDHLRNRYGSDAAVYSTATSGAVTVMIRPDGQLDVTEFVAPKRSEPAVLAAGSNESRDD